MSKQLACGIDQKNGPMLLERDKKLKAPFVRINMVVAVYCRVKAVVNIS